jgi:isocitrate dehydrogenase
VQGRSVEIGGYYHPDPKKTASAMRPSPTLNRIIESLN